jgi:hypothetical protein
VDREKYLGIMLPSSLFPLTSRCISTMGEVGPPIIVVATGTQVGWESRDDSAESPYTCVDLHWYLKLPCSSGFRIRAVPATVVFFTEFTLPNSN